VKVQKLHARGGNCDAGTRAAARTGKATKSIRGGGGSKNGGKGVRRGNSPTMQALDKKTEKFPGTFSGHRTSIRANANGVQKKVAGKGVNTVLKGKKAMKGQNHWR